MFFLLLCLKFQQGFPQTFSKIFLKELLHRNLYESLKKFVNFFSFNYFSMCFTYFMCIKGIFENVVQVRIFFKNILRESSEQSYREYFWKFLQGFLFQEFFQSFCAVLEKAFEKPLGEILKQFRQDSVKKSQRRNF